MADPVTAAMVNSFLGAKVDALDAVVDGVASDLSVTDGKVDTIDTVVDGITTDLATLEGKVDSVETKVDSLTTELANVPKLYQGNSFQITSFSFNAFTETTILSLTATEGLIDGFYIQSTEASIGTITSIKYTVDGGVEQSFTSLDGIGFGGPSVSNDRHRPYVRVPIPFSSSIVLKVTTDKNCRGQIHYNINPS